VWGTSYSTIHPNGSFDAEWESWYIRIELPSRVSYRTGPPLSSMEMLLSISSRQDPLNVQVVSLVRVRFAWYSLTIFVVMISSFFWATGPEGIFPQTVQRDATANYDLPAALEPSRLKRTGNPLCLG